jgi:DNA-binding CsgD family transcriptional regulator
MASTSKEIGRRIVGELPCGTHFCLFHEDKEDLLDAVTAFFKPGFARNEFSIWWVSEPLSPEEATSALRAQLPDFDRHLANGAIEIAQGSEWFIRNGRFDMDRVARAWEQTMQGALQRGFRAMRACGNAFWLGTDYWKDFCAFEHDLQKTISGQRLTVLCTYPLSASTASDVLEVARAHQFALSIRKGAWEFIEVAGPEQVSSLTPREREVLTWVARGKSAWEIGEILAIAKRTVDEHVQTAARKLNASNRTQAVAIALRDRLITVSIQ